MKKFAVFDIDGTVYREAMSFIVAEELLRRYDFAEEGRQLEDARHVFKSRGSTEAYWTYNKTILSIFEQILPKITPDQLNEVISGLLANKQEYCYAYTTQLVKQYKDEGRTLVAISGSIGDIIVPFSKSLGFDLVVASDLEVVNNTFTGKRATETKHGKDEILRRLIEEHELALEGSIAVGDTHRDLSMMSVTEQAIAFNPNAALYEAAKEHGWHIVLERKNMVYELVPQATGYTLASARPIFDDGHQEHLR